MALIFLKGCKKKKNFSPERISFQESEKKEKSATVLMHGKAITIVEFKKWFSSRIFAFRQKKIKLQRFLLSLGFITYKRMKKHLLQGHKKDRYVLGFCNGCFIT